MGKTYTTFDVAKICGVYPTTVVDWIDSGKLRAYVTPGGHRRIGEIDLLAFLKEHRIPLPEELAKKGTPKILIVDDNPSVVKFLSRLIEKYFPDTVYKAARDGFEAGAKFKEFVPDIVLLDIKLPGINGFEVCRKIKAGRKITRVIAMTGYDTPENRREMLHCGADDYISKPFDKDTIAGKIRKYLNYYYGKK